MSETLETLPLETFEDLPSAISSQELVSGVTRSDFPAGPMTVPCGPAPVPASLSAQPGSAAEPLMSGISGPTGAASSASAALQSSLGSRLQARMPYDGLTLFRLTWKERVTPSGRLICALRAVGHRTSGSDCTSCPTPATQNGTGGARRELDPRGWNTLQSVAQLASWPTPAVTNADRGGQAKRMVGRSNLRDAVMLSSWATPAARDWRDRRASQETMERNSRPLNEQTVQLADWLLCRDGKYRPVEPGTFPLAYGAPVRVGRLRGYGNCIVAPLAAEFIKTYREISGQ